MSNKTSSLKVVIMINIHRYAEKHERLWDDLVNRSKNGLFMFLRDYMDYHSDRFQDHSLIFKKGNRPLALLPANQIDSTLVSHGGLTFGGLITTPKMNTNTMLEIFEALKEYLKSNAIKTLFYKAIPHIYHIYPSEEDLYALFISDARLIRREISTTVEKTRGLPYNRGRNRNIRIAEKENLVLKESDDYQTFMDLKEEKLLKKYGIKPTHSAQEMEYLACKFPDNIKLFVVEREGEMIYGVIVYESKNVAHAQYQESTEEGQRLRVPDFVLDQLIHKYHKEKKYFDFGISTENNGFYLNKGLIRYKETFGGRAVVYDTYKMDVGR
jgi:hypothetical protein